MLPPNVIASLSKTVRLKKMYCKLENPSGPIDIPTFDSAFDNRMILTYDLFTSGSVHAK